MLVFHGKLPKWANVKTYLLYSVFGLSSLIRLRFFKNSNPVMFRVAKRIEKTSTYSKKYAQTNWSSFRNSD
jgi:hypothetical protein